MAKTKIEKIIKFDDAGNMVTKPPKIKELEEELEEIINGKNDVICSYCNRIWKSKTSRLRHEAWCPDNPNHRVSYRKPETKPKKKPKKPKASDAKRKVGRPPKKHQWEAFTVDDLRNIDKVFGLTDKEIIEYIRGK